MATEYKLSYTASEIDANLKKIDELPIENGTGEKSLVIGDGDAQGDYSIAGGSNDVDKIDKFKSMAQLAGYTVDTDIPTAYGDGSLSLGVGTKTHSTVSIAIGISSSAGAKGFYWHSIDWSGETPVIQLSTEQKPYRYYKFFNQKIEQNKTATWSTDAANILADWKVGDALTIINNIKYGEKAIVTAIDSTNGKITVDSLPFSSSDVKVEFSSLSDITSLVLSFDDFAIYNPSRPVHGLIEFALGALSIGAMTNASGSFSTALGYRTKVTADFGHTEGRETIANYAAHAEGNETKALGNNSHSEGFGTVSSGNQSHAEGDSTIASGYQSHAEGNGTTASGSNSHTEGNGTTASNKQSHAEGQNTTASGHNSHAEGDESIASGDNSHAEGQKTTSSGSCSHAEGRGTNELPDNFANLSTNNDIIAAWEAAPFSVAKGEASHVEGNDNLALGNYSHAEGRETTASGNDSHAEGNRTTASATAAHAEGQKTTASGNQSHAEGYKTTASGNNSHAEGVDTIASNKQSHAEGYKTTASGNNSHAEGHSTSAIGYQSHAEGHQTTASGNQSHAEGKETTAEGDNSHAEGQNTTASNYASHAEGQNTTASGEQSHAEGDETIASGYSSHAEGTYTVASGSNSHAEGSFTEARGSDSHAEGGETTAKGDCSHAEGLCTSASGDTSHAEGEETTASGDTSHAEGYKTTASGFCSHAEGIGTYALGYASHVQGKYNIQDTEGKYAHIIGNATTGNYDNIVPRSNAYTLDWQGNAWFQGSVTSNGADYAEFFEWQDGNPDNEDRVGLLVALDGEKIRLANSGDEILGIISGTAAVLGDNYECEWNGKYLTDDFSRVIYDLVEEFMDVEHIEFKEVEKEIVDEETNETRIEVELEEVKTTEKQSLGFWKHPRLNPDYDPEQAYVNRSDRPEWDTVGMLGKLYVRDNGTCEVNGYATVGENGVATASSEKTNMRVLSRVNENVIRVLLK